MNIYWTLTLACDAEIIWSNIKYIIYHAMDLFIPKVKLKSHQYPRWSTEALHYKSKCIRRKKMKKNQNTKNVAALKKAENTICSDIQKAKSLFERICYMTLQLQRSQT